MQSVCKFCSPIEDHVLFRSSNFHVMLSYGPMTEGYLLINSNVHFDCCATFTGNIAREFDLMVEMVKTILNKVYGNCLFYEHGRAGSCLGQTVKNAHCYHAHMHCVPVNVKMNKMIDKSLEAIALGSLDEFRSVFHQRKEPYLFVDDGEKYMYIANKELKSQYLRSLVAGEIGAELLWDWATYPELDKVESGKRTLLPLFNQYSLL